MDSKRIVNLMDADKFFSRKVTKNYVKRVQKERYRLQPEKAQRIVRNNLQKAVKVSSQRVEFTERQMQIAVEALKGK